MLLSAISKIYPDPHKLICISFCYWDNQLYKVTFEKSLGKMWSFFTKIKHHISHRWQTQGPRAESGLHLLLSSPAPCFYPAAALSSRLTVKEQLHSYSPTITFSPLKATARLMWPRVKMSLTPLV